MQEDKGREVYEYIRDYMLENMYSPTIREIGRATGFKSTASVKRYIDKLVKDGYIILSEHNNKMALPGYEIHRKNITT